MKSISEELNDRKRRLRESELAKQQLDEEERAVADEFLDRFIPEVILDIEEHIREMIRAGRKSTVIDFVATETLKEEWYLPRISWRLWFARFPTGVTHEDIAGCYLAKIRLLNTHQSEQVLHVVLPGDYREHAEPYRQQILDAIRSFDNRIRVCSASETYNRYEHKYYVRWDER